MSDTQENRKAEEVVKEVTITNEKPLPPDIFGRERIAEQMCQLIVDMKAEAISPLALDGKWGSGKSVHAERMKKCFEDKHADKIKCIYWNASAEDYSENPLLSFIVFLYQNVTKENRAKFKANSLRVLGTCFRQGLYNVTNQIFKNLIFVDIQEACKSVISALEQAEIERGDIVATQFGKELDGIAAVSARLDAAEQLLVSVGGKKELVIIIDELDRCRPDFALKIIESIKHLFSTENCKFILIMNKESMASSVNHLYGLGEDESFIYLNKYINRTFQLPNRYQHGIVSADCTLDYFLHLVNHGSFNNSLVKEFMKRIISTEELTLRDVEKISATIKFIQEGNMGVLQKETDIDAFFMCYVAYLFTIKHDLAMQIAEKQIPISNVLEDLGWDTNPFKGGIGIRKPAYIEYLEPLLDFYFSSDKMNNSELAKKYKGIRIINNIERYGYFFSRWMNYCSFMQ